MFPHPMDPADRVKEVKVEGFEILRIKVEDVNSEEMGRDLDDGMVRRVKIEPGSLDCMEFKEERSEEHLAIPSTKDDAETNDQERESIQTTDGSNNKRSLNIPSEIRDGVRSYKCTICGKSFSQSSSCLGHMKIHSSQRSYRCSTWGKGFNQSSHYRTHLRVHNGEGPYRCTTCGKGFIQSSRYHAHLRVHNGERPYRCSTCGKDFIQSSHYRTHLKDHNDEPPYKCTVCGKAFFQSSSFWDHKRIHSDECTICGKTFIRSSNYNTHLKMHQEERPKCTVCGKGFKHTSRLQQHMRTHSNERPYKCPLCVNAFSTLSNCKRHMKSHSRIDSIQVILTEDILKAKQRGSFSLITTGLNNLPKETIIGKLCHVLPLSPTISQQEAKTSPEAGQSNLRQTSATSEQKQDEPAM
uniref:zinc finger protein 391-like isoform X2 n=1 Tax=Myxine glutinosa TaxID=7769 RepID=UPI00358EF596